VILQQHKKKHRQQRRQSNNADGKKASYIAHNLHVYRVAQKVSHYQVSSLNRIKNRHRG